jgi:imidazolonepropionase
MQHAARALGQSQRHGALAVGRDADFVLWDIDSPAELAYWFGRNPCRCVVRGGRVVYGESVLPSA